MKPTPMRPQISSFRASCSSCNVLPRCLLMVNPCRASSRLSIDLVRKWLFRRAHPRPTMITKLRPMRVQVTAGTERSREQV
jgi:hypothetical protein